MQLFSFDEVHGTGALAFKSTNGVKLLENHLARRYDSCLTPRTGGSIGGREFDSGQTNTWGHKIT